MDPFNYDSVSGRVLFGAGRLAELADEADRLGQRALVIATPGQILLAERAAALLGDRCVGIHAQAVPHVPQETVTAAVAMAEEFQADLLVAVGGGSTIGLAKGVALERAHPILAVPTTYAGSEMTRIWGISRDGRKTTGRDLVVKPRTVIYDPELIVSLPVSLTITSGLNAMAHAVEALYAENGNPMAAIMAEESVRQLAVSLPQVAADPAALDGRARSLYGAWLAASVLDTVGMALHHKLCHTLGGSFGLPHAATHTVVLPYATAFNYSHAPKAMAALGRALNCDQAHVAPAIYDLSGHNGGPTSLKELGFPEHEIARAAVIATQNPYYNPRPVTPEGVEKLLTDAYHGKRP